MDAGNIHAGHRKRMKSSMFSHGIDSLQDHQVLEMLLFYSIPNGDTNPLAHSLIERFGSLRRVMEAEHEELVKVKGVGENTASLIVFARLLAKRYFLSTCFADDESRRFSDTLTIRTYYSGVFEGIKNEQVRVMALSDDLCLRAEGVIIEGDVEHSEVTARKIVDFTVSNGSGRIVLAHNHPNGAAMPSKNDVFSTVMLADLLDELNIELLDHIIVGKTGNYSMRSSRPDLGIWKEVAPEQQPDGEPEEYCGDEAEIYREDGQTGKICSESSV